MLEGRSLTFVLQGAKNLTDGYSLHSSQVRNMLAAINGLMYCNLKIALTAGSRVRFVMVAFGSEEGLHTPRITGKCKPSVSVSDSWLAAALAEGGQ